MMFMQIPKPLRLHTKFLTGLVLATIFLGSVFSAISYFHVNKVIEEEVRERAKLVFTHVDSIQHYVRNYLRPSMYQHFPNAFVIEAMSSSFISRQIMSPVNNLEDGIIYRRVAIDARNPDYEANAPEQRLIDLFRADAGLTLWQGYETIGEERYYVMARPVRFEQNCMYCHGKVEDAPAELLQLYGEKGFGKRLGAIAGVDFVGTSVQRSVGRLQHIIVTYFIFFAVGALFFFLATNTLFRVLVVNNLKRLHDVFRDNIQSMEGDAQLGTLEKGDEIEELVDSLEKMSDHLFETKAKLQDYTENLRDMVEQRTIALSSEIDARRADVQLFVTLLENMYTSRSRGELWKLVLPQICRRFDAVRIAYICTMAAQSSYFWPEIEPSPEIPENLSELLTSGKADVSGKRICVPVESGTGNAEGLLCIYWQDEALVANQDLNVLQALGRQLGIAAVNLTAIDSLARQMNILETIVEGISDPLALVDAHCTVLTVNRAARSLTEELSGGKRSDGNILSLFFDIRSGVCPLREILTHGTADMREVNLPDGRVFSLFLYPVMKKSGDSDQVVVYLRETTKEKRIMMQVRHAEKMATVGKLTAGLAHEINNPLGVILCYTRLLHQSALVPDQQADLDVIVRHAHQAQRVVQDLLDFARPKTPGSSQADVCAVAAAVYEVFSVKTTKKRIRTSFQCTKEKLPVQLSVGELEQILSNLMINAIDAVMEGEGVIRLSICETDNAMVAVEIEDNGPGVPIQHEAHIFDPFFSTKEVGAGTGLGLSVVYGIVTDGRGTIEVDRSAELGGARFTVLLPAVRPEIDTTEDRVA